MSAVPPQPNGDLVIDCIDHALFRLYNEERANPQMMCMTQALHDRVNAAARARWRATTEIEPLCVIHRVHALINRYTGQQVAIQEISPWRWRSDEPRLADDVVAFVWRTPEEPPVWRRFVRAWLWHLPPATPDPNILLGPTDTITREVGRTDLLLGSTRWWEHVKATDDDDDEDDGDDDDKAEERRDDDDHGTHQTR